MKAFELLLSIYPAFALASTFSIPGTNYTGFQDVEFAFFFGDSYTNNRYDINAAPHPSPSQPLGVSWPGLGSSNGPNWVAYMTSVLNSSRILSFDIAFGGATVDRSVVTPFQSYIWTLREQINRWKNRLGTRVWYPWNSGNTVAFFWVGINDIMRSYHWLNVTQGDLYEQVFDSYFAGVNQVYSTGVRNFVFMNVPPIELAPTNRGLSAQGLSILKSNVKAFNTKLLTRIQAFKATSLEVSVWHIDTFDLFNTILTNPLAYGFKNSTDSCSYYTPYSGNENWESKFDGRCGIPVKGYFWLDGLHPTSGVHWLVSSLVRWVL